MRRFVLAVAVAAASLVALAPLPPARAAAVAGVAPALLPAATSPIQPAACRRPGRYCPIGRHWVCGRYGHHCWCAPC